MERRGLRPGLSAREGRARPRGLAAARIERLIDGVKWSCASRPRAPLAFGDRFHRFRVIRTIGVGGMGVVYEAWDDITARCVALKLVAGGSRDHLRASLRLLREARALTRVSHPGVVDLVSVGAFAGHVYLAMEYVPGETLASWVRRPATGHGAIVEMFLRAGDALAAVHGAGLVHRDFKPSNVIIGAGAVRLVDFGLAVPARAWGDRDPLAGLDARARVGTPMYMSPEQCAGRPASPRSDQFAFCVALSQALQGAHPFAGDTATEDAAHIEDGGGCVDTAELPHALRAVLRRGLALAERDRWSSMATLLERLAEARRVLHRARRAQHR